MFADTKRNIGTIDPYLLEMYEGLGCALENSVLAAEAKGYSYNLKLMPNPTSKTHVATISLITRTKSNIGRIGETTTTTYSPVSETLSSYNAIPHPPYQSWTI
ncbi:MAG: hypothetical protein WCF23_24285 [Candidatus Nitrosopolaris sp.]